MGFDLELFRGPETLQLLLMNAFASKASDPKDYIYGWHSLLGDDTQFKMTVE